MEAWYTDEPYDWELDEAFWEEQEEIYDSWDGLSDSTWSTTLKDIQSLFETEDHS
jgi:hypothetical protein